MSDNAVFTPENIARYEAQALAVRAWAIERQILAQQEKLEALQKLRAMLEADVVRRGYKDYTQFLTTFVSGGNKTQYKRAASSCPRGS